MIKYKLEKKNPILSLAASKNGRFLLCGQQSNDNLTNNITLWDTDEDRIIAAFSGGLYNSPYCIGFIKDDTHIYYESYDENEDPIMIIQSLDLKDRVNIPIKNALKKVTEDTTEDCLYIQSNEIVQVDLNTFKTTRIIVSVENYDKDYIHNASPKLELFNKEIVIIGDLYENNKPDISFTNKNVKILINSPSPVKCSSDCANNYLFVSSVNDNSGIKVFNELYEPLSFSNQEHLFKDYTEFAILENQSTIAIATISGAIILFDYKTGSVPKNKFKPYLAETGALVFTERYLFAGSMKGDLVKISGF